MMKLRGSIIAKTVLLPILAISVISANYFIVRGAITSENNFRVATNFEMEKYFENTGENKVFGTIKPNGTRTVKQEYQTTLIKWNYEEKIHKSNTIYYVSQVTEDYTPVRYTTEEIDVKMSVLIMPILDQEVGIKNYFDLTFLTDISESFPHKRSSSAIIPKTFADQLITERKLNKGNYKSLIGLTATFEVTKGNTWATSILIAGIFDDTDVNGQFYQEAYGTCIIMPHTADIYYIDNMKLNIEFVKNSKKNIELLSYIEILINASRKQFSWEILQKDSTNEFKVGSIQEVKTDSKEFFSTLGSLDKSGANIIISLVFIIIIIICGFLLKKTTKEKDFYIMFGSSCAIGIIISVVFMAITMNQTLPINEYIRVNRELEVTRASLFLTFVFTIFTVLIPKIFKDFQKYLGPKQ